MDADLKQLYQPNKNNLKNQNNQIDGDASFSDSVCPYTTKTKPNNSQSQDKCKKSVRFRLNNSVYSVECEYTSKNKANIDEQLRDDLSDDDFENEDLQENTPDNSESKN